MTKKRYIDWERSEEAKEYLKKEAKRVESILKKYPNKKPSGNTHRPHSSEIESEALLKPVGERLQGSLNEGLNPSVGAQSPDDCKCGHRRISHHTYFGYCKSRHKCGCEKFEPSGIKKIKRELKDIQKKSQENILKIQRLL